MTKKEYEGLPIATKLVTDAGFVWMKISNTKWRCTYTPKHFGWKIDDIYTDTGGEHKEKGHKYILPFDLYLNEIESGSI